MKRFLISLAILAGIVVLGYGALILAWIVLNPRW
jgi:hypothetical protein